MSVVVDRDQFKAELDAVIASGIFAKAPSLALLLEYVCNKYLEGQAEQIKEYNIAVEALGRPSSFDPRQDSIVRVEAFRLRKRLKQYYETEGVDHPWRILIPPGQYVPQFVQNVPGESNGATDQVPEAEVALQAALLPAASLEVDGPPARPVTPPRVVVAGRGAWIRWAAFAVLPSVAILLWTIWFLGSRPAKAPGAAGVAALPSGAESGEVRILAGSSVARYVDHNGNIWSGDRYFQGGTVFATPDHMILGTPDPEMFRSRREGNFTYDIPLKPGVYELHLYFAETLYGENNTAGGGESSRVFRVSVNNTPVLPSFDVIADAGGSNTADERVFKDLSPAADGKLHVQFTGLVNNVPIVSALEVVPGIPGRMHPVRIIMRARNYTDRLGHVWGADRYFFHGLEVSRVEPVSNTADQEIFQGERFGNFHYAIPVADGRYTVTLRFAETWFGPGKPGGGGVGSRIFDVYCNGTTLLRNFDILRSAGGPQHAIEKTFHGVTPDAQGKIMLSFVPVVNYACVNAIEVVDEGS